MSMDHFLEEVASPRKTTIQTVLTILTWMVIIFCGAMALLTFSQVTAMLANGFDLFTLLIFLFSAGCAVLAFLNKDKIRTEYEYTFTNGALDFAAVYNNVKRKSLGSLNVKTVEAFGAVNGDSFQRYLNTPGVKQMRWFVNREAELYYFFFQKEGNKKIIIFEPSEEMVGLIKQYLPFGSLQK